MYVAALTMVSALCVDLPRWATVCSLCVRDVFYDMPDIYGYTQ